MILDGGQSADGGVTLDELFRRAGVRRPDALALIDPPHATTVTGGEPRRLNYAQADRAISAFAGRLRRLGLQTDAVVALQLPNNVAGAIALLGILRAGMIAAPLPLLWRRQEMVAALSRANAKAIVTYAAQAETVMQAAAELFPVRHVCGFGGDLPDGVAPLDDVFAAHGAEFFQAQARPGPAAAHVAAITFEVTGGGIVPRAHCHAGLVEGGRAAVAQAGLGPDATILSTIPPSSFAGIALTLVPWLIAGGTLALQHGFDPAAFAEQARAQQPSAVVLPGPALAPLAEAGLLDAPVQTIFALWRATERLSGAPPWRHTAVLVDVACAGETVLHAARRGSDGSPAPSPPDATAGLTTVGGYRLHQREVEAVVAAVDPAAVIAALPDALLGLRLAGSAADPGAVAAELAARGVNPLIAGAFRPRQKAQAA